MSGRLRIPQCTLAQFEGEFGSRHLLDRVIRYWTERKPDAPALVEDRGKSLTWMTLSEHIDKLAAWLWRRGVRKGDFVAALLPFTAEQVALEYACFRLGAVFAPLDLRLPATEVARCVAVIGARALAYVERPAAGTEIPLPLAEIRETLGAPAGEVPQVEVDENDGALAIFTTGSTGAPKAALLSHRGITCQNMCLGTAFGFGENTRMLVNLPPSHVGGQAEELMTALYGGGTAVVMETFDAARSLEAIERHRITLIGQVPAMFHMEWRLSDYSRHDLSSLEGVLYGGQQVNRQFLEKLAGMAPRAGSGLGLTEASGFCTFTPAEAGLDELAASIGYDMPVYPISIREPMCADGSAGREMPEGQTGHICFRGPQTFSGYVNDAEATARTISRDKYLYTGDMGFLGGDGLYFAGRAKWVIKPAGYQVFPGDVEAHLAALNTKVTMAGAVGAPHAVFSEAIVAFVERRPGAELTVQELKAHARGMAGYMRPLHYVLLEPGQMPLNRVGKIDYVTLHERALGEVERLRAQRKWDR